jgi:hypothetical protein
MPFFKAGGKLVYYAHVPKCGGSAVETYLADRFGLVAFHDKTHTQRPKAQQWSRTSPQHIDAETLATLIPPGFFDACFTIVRHPVARIVSAYHFQRDVERLVSARVVFSEWLEDLADARAENPFAFDNHVRPMSDIVPEGAEVFHLEHGLDRLVLWLDALTGTRGGQRAIPHVNKHGEYRAGAGEKVVPTATDIAVIARIFAEDFRRFGYQPDRKAPLAAAPDLPADFVAERDQALKAMNRPLAQVARRIRRRVGL